MKSIINKNALLVFMGVCIFFPNDIGQLKIISLFFLFIFNLDTFILNIRKGKYLWIYFFGAAFPLYLAVQSYILNGSLYSAVSYSYPFSILLLIIIINEYHIDYTYMLTSLLKCLSLLIIALLVFDLLRLYDLNGSPIRDFIYAHEIGKIGKSAEYSLYYKIYLHTCALLIICLTESIMQKKIIMFLYVSASFILSGSRANIIGMLSLFLLLMLINIKKKNLFIGLFIVFSILMVICVFKLDTIISIITEFFFSTNSQLSDNTRIGHFKGLMELYQQDKFLIITGMGFGSKYYSYGTLSMVSDMEWTFLDLFRKIGIVSMFIFMCFLMIPLLSKHVKTYKKAVLLCYLLIASTNPLLVTSTAFLLYLYIYIDVPIKNSKEKTLIMKGKNHIQILISCLK